MFHLQNYDSDQKMDSADFPLTRSPRKELQGPRPPALKVNKDSQKIKKPPIAPHQSQNHRQQPPPWPPVIIYDVSPKVIQTHPKDFMDLVQRLTGPSSSSVSTSAANPFTDDGGAISLAARFATVERAKSSKEKMMLMTQQQQDLGNLIGIEQVIEKSGNTFPGILSPGPASLPAISPNFFSPASDPNWLSFLHDLSPAVNSNNFMASPSTFVPPRFTSPTSFDLFNNIFDF